MLRRISEPLALSEASLLALRPALNAPVLNVEFLPVGPARAAIVVFAEEYGGIGLAVGIRSTEGGQVAVFKNVDSIDESTALADVLEPALSSAERMGFLFDEDMIDGASGSQGRSDATALWGRLMGDVAMPPSPKAAPPLPAATEPILDLTEPMGAEAEGEELILEEVAPLPPFDETEEIELNAVAAKSAAKPKAAPVAQDAAPAPVVEPDRAIDPPMPRLSKFRQAVTGPGADAPPKKAKGKSTPKHSAAGNEDAASALGRVSLVRVRRGADRLKRIPYLARLLSTF